MKEDRQESVEVETPVMIFHIQGMCAAVTYLHGDLFAIGDGGQVGAQCLLVHKDLRHLLTNLLAQAHVHDACLIA